MKKLIPVSIVGILMFLFLGFASANADIQVTIDTTNATEFNDATPDISVTATGNETSYLCNLTMGASQVVTNTNVTNATSTALTASTLTERAWYVTNATCWSTESGPNSSSDSTFQINGRPSVSSVTESTSSVIPKKGTLTFTVAWTDANASGTDGVRVYVCKTNAFSGGSCTGGQWCANTTYEADNSSECTYTVPIAGASGVKNYYVFTRDDNGYDSSSGTSGSFIVGGDSEDYDDVADDIYWLPESVKDWLTRDKMIGIGVVVIIFAIIAFLAWKPKNQ